ncbi:Hypothetical protein NTJ_06983 [Nesidiocoris tenuis]|uniref:Uncharacterized protein n=1 Tax=Nesidiocoris tenuis TaxID=355587 RepID=A0ABN7ART7_9HEMI|nr:Hypothetical protein NTJ_06983 [Nesidiocoris tenuis]
MKCEFYPGETSNPRPPTIPDPSSARSPEKRHIPELSHFDPTWSCCVFIPSSHFPIAIRESKNKTGKNRRPSAESDFEKSVRFVPSFVAGIGRICPASGLKSCRISE